METHKQKMQKQRKLNYLSQLKILPVEKWMKHHIKRKDLNRTCKWIIQMVPIVGKNGYYYSRHDVYYDQIFVGKWYEEKTHLFKAERMVWFEYEGKAYALRGYIKQFKYDLAVYNHRPMKDCEYKALTMLYNAKLLNTGMKLLLELEKDCRATRNGKREAIKNRMRYDHIYKLR